MMGVDKNIMKLSDYRQHITEKFSTLSDTPQLDADLLLMHVFFEFQHNVVKVNTILIVVDVKQHVHHLK